MTIGDVVFTFSYETWSDARSRGMMRPPDRLLATLLSHPEVDRVLVANPYRFAPTETARRVLGRDAPFPATQHHRLHRPLRARRADPLDIGALERTYRAYSFSLRRAAQRLGLIEPAIVTTNPLVAGFGTFEWGSQVTYFGRDDWSSSPARRQYWPAYREAYDRMSRSGVAVAAVSQQILDRIAPTGPARVVPNGVEEAEWLAPQPAPPAWFAGIPGPRATYVGTLDSRLDVEGIRAFAIDRPDLQIVLIGPLPDPSYLAPLSGLANVHVHGHIGRAEIVAVLRSSELTLLAHRRTPLTEAMSPLKVYEYLAAGAPVLSIDLAPVRNLGERVHLVDSVAEFSTVAERALASGRQAEHERSEWVRANSWTSRHESILDMCRTVPNVSNSFRAAEV